VKKRANTRFSLTAKGDAMRPAIIIDVSSAGTGSFRMRAAEDLNFDVALVKRLALLRITENKTLVPRQPVLLV
jgi:hypothetical protein